MQKPIADELVFNDVPEATRWKLENYLAVVANHMACPTWAKAYKGRDVVSANVSYAVALEYVMREMKKGMQTCHLRETLDLAARTNHIKVSTAGADLIDKGATTFCPVKAGYYVMPGRDAAVLPSWVSDSVAYQMTSTVDKTMVGIEAQTMTRSSCQNLQMTQQEFRVDVPANFSHNPVDNSRALFALYERQPTDVSAVPYALPLAHAQIASNWEDRSTRKILGVPHPRVADYVESTADGSNFLPTPKMALQPHSGVLTEDFYRVLSEHKKRRGSDKKGVASLSAGYYFGSMSRSLDRVSTLVVDVLTAAIFFDREGVIFDGSEANHNVLVALFANSMQPYVLRTIKVESKYCKSLNLTQDKMPKDAFQVVSNYFGDAVPTVTAKGIVGQTEFEFSAKFSDFRNYPVPLMTYVYLRNYHEEFLEYIVPSTSAHSGRVMMLNRPFVDTMSLKQHFGRMSMANKYKTAFPVRRVTYATQDMFRSSVVDDGFFLCMGANSAPGVEYVNVDSVIDVEELENMQFEPHEFKSTLFKQVPPGVAPQMKVPLPDPVPQHVPSVVADSVAEMDFSNLFADTGLQF